MQGGEGVLGAPLQKAHLTSLCTCWLTVQGDLAVGLGFKSIGSVSLPDCYSLDKTAGEFTLCGFLMDASFILGSRQCPVFLRLHVLIT